MWPALIFLSISHTSDWLPHIPLTTLCPATLLVGCLYPYRPPHFWLDATLSFSSYRFAPATLLTGPHTHSSFYYLSHRCQACTNMVCAPWSVRTPGSYISPQSIVLYFPSLDNNRYSLLTLGAEGVIPGRYIVSLLRVFKQFTHTLPSR